MDNSIKENFCKKLTFKTKINYAGILVERKMPPINSDFKHPSIELAENGWFCGYVVVPKKIKIKKDNSPVFITYTNTLANYLNDKNVKGFVYGFDHLHTHDTEFPPTQKQVINEIEELAKFLKKHYKQ